MRPYVEQLVINQLHCIQSEAVTLTPFHAFIGPNDSGKSTLLRALAAFSGSDYPTQRADRSHIGATVREVNGSTQSFGTHPFGGSAPAPLHRVQMLKPDPQAAREASNLIPTKDPLAYRTIGGAGLAAVCDAISGREIEHWVELRRQFSQMFTTVKALEIQNVDEHRKILGALLHDGRRISAPEMSEGMIYWLLFSALQYADKPGILLVEEPENGLHPARIAEVMKVLRAVSEHTQVVIATHSPLVINEMRDDEVSIVTRTVEHGTKVRRIHDTPNFEARRKVYELGELWLSYADGVEEAPLFAPTSSKTAS